MSRVAGPLSPLQQHVLGVLKDAGTCDAHELGRHLLVDGVRLGAPLLGLERRGLIGRTYTGHHFGSGHAYVITEDGREAAIAAFSEEGDD
jgi:DNA-binding MarR family transcriptional regulator